MLKKLLIALLPLGTIAVVVWLALPEYRAFGETKNMRKEADQALQEKQELVAKIKSLEAQYAKVGDVTQKVAQIIPPTPDIPNLLVEIPEMVLQHGLTLNDLTFGAREGDESTKPANSSLPYRTMDASLSLTGSFDAFRIFLKALEKELRIMDVEDLQFSIPRQGEGLEPYTFTLRVRMYYGLAT